MKHKFEPVRDWNNEVFQQICYHCKLILPTYSERERHEAMLIMIKYPDCESYQVAAVHEA